ncbi:MAG: BON domain-containing protein, partial [Candidatus Methylomirabilota bacterium]
RAALRADQETMRFDLNIASTGGHITLTGMVFSNAAKDSVERIVKSVVGVRTVENQVRVFREW